jgi:hypothetical protein
MQAIRTVCHLCGELWYHMRAEGFTYVSFTHLCVREIEYCMTFLMSAAISWSK